MTKRKRTPSSSPAPRARVSFQIPASLQRLSMISRSLAHQSDTLAVNADGPNPRIIAQAQALGGATPSVATASSKTEVRDGRGHGFRAFAPPKQPSFPDAQTWVAPTPRRLPIPDDTGFMPSTQPSFPPGQAWPQPQPRKVVPWPQSPSQTAATLAPTPPPSWVPPPVPTEATLTDLEAPPAEGETLCLETQPNRIAALIAQKRAANEANRRREAWTRQAAAHRMSSQAPDDQLLNELNSALGQSSVANNAAQASTSSLPQQYVTPTTPITFDPVIPSAGVQAHSETVAQTDKASKANKKPARDLTSARPAKSTERALSHDHDSLFSSSGTSSPSPTEPRKQGGGHGQHSRQQANRQDSLVDRLSVAASTAPAVVPQVIQIRSHSSKRKISNSRHSDTSSARQTSQTNPAPPVAAGYYRFNPRHWQTSSTSQQQQQQQQATQHLAPAAQSAYQRIEASAWPASHEVQQKGMPNPVFRNLTQDKFGRFGVGGKLKEAVAKQNGAGAS